MLVSILDGFWGWTIRGFPFIRMQVLYFLSIFDGYFFCIPNKNVNIIGQKRNDPSLTVIEIRGGRLNGHDLIF